jgi:hypothetical protein
VSGSGSQFHFHVVDRGIGHVYIKPATPRLKGKVERSHRIDAEEFYRMLEGVVIDDTGLFNVRLRSGRTSTTSIDRTALSAAKRPMRSPREDPRLGMDEHRQLHRCWLRGWDSNPQPTD